MRDTLAPQFFGRYVLEHQPLAPWSDDGVGALVLAGQVRPVRTELYAVLRADVAQEIGESG